MLGGGIVDFYFETVLFTLFTGVDSYLPWYTFAVPDMGVTSYVAIVVPTNRRGGLSLDNNPISSINGSDDHLSYKGTQFAMFSSVVSAGSHVMIHNDGVPFGLYVYGWKGKDAYGYVAGMKFTYRSHQLTSEVLFQDNYPGINNSKTEMRILIIQTNHKN